MLIQLLIAIIVCVCISKSVKHLIREQGHKSKQNLFGMHMLVTFWRQYYVTCDQLHSHNCFLFFLFSVFFWNMMTVNIWYSQCYVSLDNCPIAWNIKNCKLIDWYMCISFCCSIGKILDTQNGKKMYFLNFEFRMFIDSFFEINKDTTLQLNMQKT